MKHVQKIYVKEESHRDPIFSGNGDNFNVDIKDDKEYSDTRVRSWYYTNIPNKKIWIDTDGFPMIAKYSGKMFSSKKYGKGVFIVKSFIYRTEDFSCLSQLSSSLDLLDFKLDDECKENLIDEIYYKTLIENRNRDFKLRFVYFVDIESIENRTFFSKRIRLGLNLEEMYDVHRNDTESDPGVVTIYIKNYSPSKTNNLHIGNDKIPIPTIPSTHECANLRIKDDKGYLLYNKFIKDSELGTLGLIRNNDFDMKEAMRKFTDRDSELINSVNIRNKAISEWRKGLLDQDVSLHKVSAYAINNLIAESKLNKEEATAFKDGIKILKDILL